MITDELREYVGSFYLFRYKDVREKLDAIADRIEIAHKHAIGYVDDRDPETMAEHGWIRLPKDADGEYIHLGDVMEGVDKYDSLRKVTGKVITVSYESDGIVDVAIQVWNSDSKSWHRAYLDPDASVYHHHHAPTVEDVLSDFARLYDSIGGRENEDELWETLLAEYAAKLQLKEDE